MADRNDDIHSRLLGTFQVEAQEHLQAIAAALSALERLPGAETVSVLEGLFREVHTLKGAARCVGLRDVEGLCQATELLLGKITRGTRPFTAATRERLQAAIDGMAKLLAGHSDPGKVEALIAQLEDGGAAGHAATQPEAPAPGPAPIAWVQTARGPAQGSSSLEGGNAAPPVLWPALQKIERQARELLGSLTGDARALGKITDELEDEMRRLRMVPVATVVDLFPRMLRDLAAEQHKEVEWVCQGAHLEIDRKVLEAMKEPLIHLVRNAIDHGIEPPARRVQAGKPSRGRIELAVAPADEGRITVEVKDDGAGMDAAQLRAAAVRGGFLTAEEAEQLSDAQAIELIYRSGLSTSPISNVSGRGLGLAIVREQVERLGGKVSVDTQPGAGTTVRLTLPTSIARRAAPHWRGDERA